MMTPRLGASALRHTSGVIRLLIENPYLVVVLLVLIAAVWSARRAWMRDR